MSIRKQKDKPQISIILATYNEAGNIIPLIKEIIKQLDESLLEIIVVDDNSPDLTWQQVEEFQKKEKRVILKRRINEKGLTSAFNAGIEISNGAIIGWMDADFQHPVEKLSELYNAINIGYDAAIGSRFAPGGKDFRVIREHLSFAMLLQGFLSRIISKITSILLFSTFRDWTSGFIMIRSEVLKSYGLRGNYGEYFMYLVNDLIRNNHKIIEIPYILSKRRSGDSKTALNLFVLFTNGIKYLFAVFTLFLKNIVKI